MLPRYCRPGVERGGVRPPAPARRPAWQPAIPLSGRHILDGGVLQGQVRIHALEPGILGLQLLDPPQFGNRHAGVLALPLVEGGDADATLAAHLCHRDAGLGFLQDFQDLAFA